MIVSIIKAALIFSILTLPAHLSAESKVPAEYRTMINPVMLTQDKVAYWWRQYFGKCAGCHGVHGNAAREMKEMYTPEQLKEMGLVLPADFTDLDYMNSRTDGELFYQISHGGAGNSYMPAFGADSDVGWGEKKVWGIVAFIRLLGRAETLFALQREAEEE